MFHARRKNFNLEFLRSMLQDEHDVSTVHEEKLERIPRVKKIAGPADVMD